MHAKHKFLHCVYDAGPPQGPDPAYAVSQDGDSAGGADGMDGPHMTGSMTPRHGTPSQKGVGVCVAFVGCARCALVKVRNNVHTHV
jgi:hypothetical protein